MAKNWKRAFTIVAAIPMLWVAGCVTRMAYLHITEFQPQAELFKRLRDYSRNHPEQRGEMVRREWDVSGNEWVVVCRIKVPLFFPDDSCGKIVPVSEPAEESTDAR